MEDSKHNSIVTNHPIICPHCKKDTGYTQEQFQYYVIDNDILCPHCNQVVIKSNKPMY